jgi:hypothetical protein
MASSVFVRHTLNALYSDLHVELRRVNVLGSSSTRGPSLSLSAGEKGTPESGETEDTAEEEQGTQTEKSRDKSVFIGLCVRGTARVSGGVGQWDV